MEQQGSATAEPGPTNSAARKITVPVLRDLKSRGERIVVVTAYDYPSARLADRAGVDAILVGDSVMLALGYDTTVPVTLDQIIHHVKAARAGIKSALLIADMPFGSFQVSTEEAIRNATRLMKECGAQAVKLEGGAPVVETVRRMTSVGIPVVGHLGLTPQSVHQFGGHKAQGSEERAARAMVEDAVALEAAGAFAIVLETIPGALAGEISRRVAIPTIGIGAGPECDGQVQVWYDIMGIYPGKKFRHVKRYAEIGQSMEAVLKEYADDVRGRRFPTEENTI